MTPDLESFHRISRDLDFRKPAAALLELIREGRIADRDRSLEAEAIELHLMQLSLAWESVFPSFPVSSRKRRTIMWERQRGMRDAYLRGIISSVIQSSRFNKPLIVNPATVFGRHARLLAGANLSCEVLGTDYDSKGDQLYRLVSPLLHPGLTNYRFERENVYEPELGRSPAVVSFFGACGSVTDGCMDYALAEDAPFLICRSCCHDNIGGNTEIVRRPSFINKFFALKNREFERIRKRESGWYFSDRYGKEAYPRSRVFRGLMDSDTMIDIARNTPDSDICRILIDLDRCLYLREYGYDVIYREELFFAHKRVGSSTSVEHP